MAFGGRGSFHQILDNRALPEYVADAVACCCYYCSDMLTFVNPCFGHIPSSRRANFAPLTSTSSAATAAVQQPQLGVSSGTPTLSSNASTPPQKNVNNAFDIDRTNLLEQIRKMRLKLMYPESFVDDGSSLSLSLTHVPSRIFLPPLTHNNTL